MFAIGVPPGTKLPFTTVVLGQRTFPHMHRDVSGFGWKEQITQDIHVLAVDLSKISMPVNDNQRAA
ncbi:hypothetical protein [Bradyrhizobium sp. DASA03007]|uniref:hypothetical protein n=1 Tax=unclassified Bradyrhizobium TaxID=2631580 RepID=UPI003F7093A0